MALRGSSRSVESNLANGDARVSTFFFVWREVASLSLSPCVCVYVYRKKRKLFNLFFSLLFLFFSVRLMLEKRAKQPPEQNNNDKHL